MEKKLEEIISIISKGELSHLEMMEIETQLMCLKLSLIDEIEREYRTRSRSHQ